MDTGSQNITTAISTIALVEVNLNKGQSADNHDTNDKPVLKSGGHGIESDHPTS
jgi:hypothetical protein